MSYGTIELNLMPEDEHRAGDRYNKLWLAFEAGNITRQELEETDPEEKND